MKRTDVMLEPGAAGVGTRAARIGLVVVWLSGIVHSLVRADFAMFGWIGAATYLTALAGAFILTVVHPGGLTRAEGAALLFTTTAVLLSVLATADIGDSPASDIWLLNFVGYLLALTIARGSPWAGGIGIAVQLTLILIWSFATGQPADGVVEMLTLPVSAAIVGITWLLVFRAIVRRERRVPSASTREESRLMTRVSAEAELTVAAELAQIARIAVPLLRRVARGDVIDEGFVNELTAAEGAIRDRIRAPELAHPVLTDAVDRARAVGIHVLVLGSAGEQDDTAGGEPISDALAAAMGDIIQTADAHTLTIRALAVSRGTGASLVSQNADGTADRWVLDAAGQPVNGQISGT